MHDKKPKTVDGYINSAPEEVQRTLTLLRKTIKSAAPAAIEKISYGMPYYGYKGKLAYFRLSAHHIGLYIPPPIVAEHKKELSGYETAIATIKFSLNKPLPIRLIKKLIKARIIYNKQKSKKTA